MVTRPSPGTGFVRERRRDMRAQADQSRLDGMRQRIGALRVGDPAAPGDRAIYEPMRLGEAEADFRRRYPEFDPDGAFKELRRLEYARLDEGDHIYLDYTGGSLHAASQIDAHAELLRARVLGNPHSNSPASLASTEFVERPRRVVREFFNAPEDDYLCVFTANASAALRLVGESYRFAPGGTFALTADNHNSVNGIREFARRKGAEVVYVPVTAPELRVERAAMSRVLRAAAARRPQPAGLPGPVQLLRRAASPRPRRRGACRRVGRARRRGGLRAHQPLDVARVRPDFAALSFYKMMGFPTGIGCLLLRRDRLDVLARPWFAGGTDHDRLRGRRRSLSAPRRGRLRGRDRRLPEPAGRDDRAPAHGPGRPRRDPSPGRLPDRLAARCPRRPPPRERTAAGGDPRTRRDPGPRRDGGLLDVRSERTADRRPPGGAAGEPGQHLAAHRMLLQSRGRRGGAPTRRRAHAQVVRPRRTNVLPGAPRSHPDRARPAPVGHPDLRRRGDELR